MGETLHCRGADPRCEVDPISLLLPGGAVARDHPGPVAVADKVGARYRLESEELGEGSIENRKMFGRRDRDSAPGVIQVERQRKADRRRRHRQVHRGVSTHRDPGGAQSLGETGDRYARTHRTGKRVIATTPSESREGLGSTSRTSPPSASTDSITSPTTSSTVSMRSPHTGQLCCSAPRNPHPGQRTPGGPNSFEATSCLIARALVAASTSSRPRPPSAPPSRAPNTCSVVRWSSS